MVYLIFTLEDRLVCVFNDYKTAREYEIQSGEEYHIVEFEPLSYLPKKGEEFCRSCFAIHEDPSIEFSPPLEKWWSKSDEIR